MRLCVVGEKGGTGKTTIATNLAAMLACAGRDVLLVDADTQRTASKWQAIRSENESLPRVSCVQLLGRGLAGEVNAIAPRFQDVIIDTGGRDTVEMRAALIVSELAVLPFLPSQFDLWTVELMHAMLENASALNPELKVLSVVSKAETNLTTLDYLDAQAFLKDFPGIVPATRPIRNRVAFKRAGQSGMSVVEYERNPLSKSTVELQQLYNDIFA